ncbi:unnamed protein product [Heterobilharzia americana]|nr:unnamed protein product [Heterobilharzia americana]
MSHNILMNSSVEHISVRNKYMHSKFKGKKAVVGQMKALVYTAENFVPLNWSEDIADSSSALHKNLVSGLIFQVSRSLQLQDSEISLAFDILNVTFRKVPTQPNFTNVTQGVMVTITLEFGSLKASKLSDGEITTVLTEGWKKLNVTLGSALVDIQFSYTLDATKNHVNQTFSTDPTSIPTPGFTSRTQNESSIETRTAPQIGHETEFNQLTTITSIQKDVNLPISTVIINFEVKATIHHKLLSTPLKFMQYLNSPLSYLYKKMGKSFCNIINKSLREGYHLLKHYVYHMLNEERKNKAFNDCKTKKHSKDEEIWSFFYQKEAECNTVNFKIINKIIHLQNVSAHLPKHEITKAIEATTIMSIRVAASFNLNDTLLTAVLNSGYNKIGGLYLLALVNIEAHQLHSTNKPVGETKEVTTKSVPTEYIYPTGSSISMFTNVRGYVEQR